MVEPHLKWEHILAAAELRSEGRISLSGVCEDDGARRAAGRTEGDEWKRMNKCTLGIAVSLFLDRTLHLLHIRNPLCDPLDLLLLPSRVVISPN